MQNISYFCIVKQFKNIHFRYLYVIILLIFSGSNAIKAQNQDSNMDSVEIGLLTCSPHQEVYSLYGHTAIRYHDLRNNIDYAFNYGMFDFRKPFFVLRFAFGLTDYELGIIPFDAFVGEYYSYGSKVTEQILNLTPKEKMALRNALEENYKPENRIYRYNYFKDNCTTRARDIIIRCIKGQVRFSYRKGYNASYREMIHGYNQDYPWARFGNDLALGLTADFKTNQKQQQFLPGNLLADFGKAIIYNPDGTTRHLVSKTIIVVKPGAQIIKNSFPLTPLECAAILFCITALITIYEHISKKITWAFDAIMMTMCGLAGILIVVLFCSQHPTTSTNLLVLIFNPLPLFFIPKMIKSTRNKNKDNFFIFSIIPIVLLLMVSVTSLQEIPVAIDILALCLLLRCISKYPTWTKNNDK